MAKSTTDWERFLEKLREELAELLTAARDRIGLTEAAVRQLVAAAIFVPVEDEAPLFERTNEDDLVYFVVRGAIRVTLPSSGAHSLMLFITPPGQFILTGSYFRGNGRHHRFGAEGHIPSWVAVWSETVIAEVLALLPDAQKVRLMRCPWAGLSSQLELAHRLRMLPLGEKLLEVFRVLVRNFGSRQPNGWLVQLPITVNDLARLAGCALRNVYRSVKASESRGLVKRVARKHWLVSDEVMQARTR